MAFMFQLQLAQLNSDMQDSLHSVQNRHAINLEEDEAFQS